MLTVTFVDWDGTVLKVEQVPYGGSATAPADPARSGYTFTGWDKGFTNVTSSITVTALYDPVVPFKETFVPEDPKLTSNEVLGQIIDGGMPSISLGGMAIPLAPGEGLNQYVWALLNIILAIAGGIVAIMTVIRALRQRREKKGYEENLYAYESEYNELQKKHSLGWVITAVGMGILGLIFFFLTEDTSNLMVLIDNWTIVSAVIFVLTVIGYRFGFRRKSNDDYEATEEV
jgi:uncharacterized repeat protein (TIGR02543 family)